MIDEKLLINLKLNILIHLVGKELLLNIIIKDIIILMNYFHMLRIKCKF